MRSEYQLEEKEHQFMTQNKRFNNKGSKITNGMKIFHNSFEKIYGVILS